MTRLAAAISHGDRGGAGRRGAAVTPARDSSRGMGDSEQATREMRPTARASRPGRLLAGGRAVPGLDDLLRDRIPPSPEKAQRLAPPSPPSRPTAALEFVPGGTGRTPARGRHPTAGGI